MIGVIADSTDLDVVREFFELFKTPWEFYRPHQTYKVVLCAAEVPFDVAADLVLVYSSRRIRFDEERNIEIRKRVDGLCILSDSENEIPIYGGMVLFSGPGTPLLTHENMDECAALFERTGGTTYLRIGYNLFAEIRTLLTAGQPSDQAHIPTLELHIDLLRRWIIGSGIELVEIPPVPEGYRFIACLTHDVDHPSIRQHKWDHTIYGFLYRALFGSVGDLLRGRISFRGVITNWAAALKLPFVYLGLANDFWRDFDKRYSELEKGLSSTFFVIPRKNDPGKSRNGAAPKIRASSYGAEDIVDLIRNVTTAGSEIGLHGIDAWCDSEKGREELEAIRRLTKSSGIGVRIHWLYYGEQSPELLEKAGAVYDSTVGYNETVGYRAGATQVYKPLGANHLLELPLHVMDTALFYPSRLGLSPRDAMRILRRMVTNAAELGGCLTINWHDRSTAPERLWRTYYRDLLCDLKREGAWFATAGQAVTWFRYRRSATFGSEEVGAGAVRVKIGTHHDKNLPRMRLRVHQRRTFGRLPEQSSGRYKDILVDKSVDSIIPSGVHI